MDYTELGNIRWPLLLKLAKASRRFFSLWLIGEAQWTHLAVLALDVAHWAASTPKVR